MKWKIGLLGAVMLMMIELLGGGGERAVAKPNSVPNGVYYKDKVLVLMYHEISDNPKIKSIISPELFNDQLETIVNRGFRVISMDDYVAFMLDHKPVPNNAVLLTFDDGYESFYTEVYPILKKWRLTATNFVIVSSIDNPKHVGRPKLSWEQMKEMKAGGMSFFNHTFDSHQYGPYNGKGDMKPVLSKRLYLKDYKRIETKEEFTIRVTKDLTLSERMLRQKLGNTYGVLAFPYGAYRPEVIQVAKKTDISLMFTVNAGINTRADRIGYRLNAGNQKMNPDKLIQLMKHQGRRQDIHPMTPYSMLPTV
ncbi:polysaccharide deacetylase family protein [Paenibacillus sp. GCM10027629]|uniref:polysaccharide deacetylase family protein n=1 Tax=Paenibacillus sp. GCM10027629 TaxID=3273414 RepID=UPI003644CDBB